MMNIIRAVLAASALYLGAQWYNTGGTDVKAPDVPSNVILDVSEEVFPPAPQNALGTVLEPLKTILKGQSQDSLVIARAFRDFATLSARTPGAVTLKEYSEDYKNALRILLTNTGLAGKYQGRIDEVVNAAFREQMKPFADSNGEYPNQAIDQQVRNKIVEWLSAVSGTCHEIYKSNLLLEGNK